MYDPNLHLLVDDDEIDARWNLRRVLARPAQRTEDPVLRPDRPWEGAAAGLWASVLFDAVSQRYRLWYRSFDESKPPHRQNLLNYATSRDGVTWEKPELGLVEVGGSRANNVVYSPQDVASNTAMETHGVIVDEVGAPERRYKLVAYHNFADATPKGLYGLFSPDGLHWTRTKAPLLLGAGDRHAALKDAATGEYIVYTRQPHSPALSSPSYPQPEIPGQPLGERLPYKRLITRTTSRDFLTWSGFTTVLRMDDFDSPGTQFYSISPFRYGNRFLAFVDLYDADVEKMWVTLASSLDGVRWNRPRREPILDLGPDGRWDDTWINVTNNPPVRVGDDLRFWYMGRDTGHGLPYRHGAIGSFVLGADRFAGLVAGRQEGRFVTEVVRAGGPRLFLNARLANGVATVELRGALGEPIPGYTLAEADEIRGDRIDHPVTWQGRAELGRLHGEAVRLHVQVTYGTVYAYRFGAAARSEAASKPA
ncbi:MAG: hypothetical protein FJ029_00755 [Actinobacteria bacterium]|nr:hypothetical protein [Actinomycetota bacterium]